MRLLEHKPESVASVSWRRNRAAEALHAVILRTVEGLPSAPYLFRAGRVIGTRECVVHPNYVVIYLVGTDAIDVLRVLHARQEYP